MARGRSHAARARRISSRARERGRLETLRIEGDAMQSSRSVVAFLCASLLPPLAGAQQLAVPDTETHIGAQPLTRQPPIYPKAALAQAKEGWVMISYVISPEG